MDTCISVLYSVLVLMKIMEIHSPRQENVLCDENNCSGKECGVKNSQI